MREPSADILVFWISIEALKSLFFPVFAVDWEKFKVK